jgi:hypothetical protein
MMRVAIKLKMMTTAIKLKIVVAPSERLAIPQ